MEKKRTKMSLLERAKQFAPFASLRGFDKLVKEKEKIICPRKELTEEKAAELSNTVSTLKKGSIVRVIYYQTDGYASLEGVLSRIDLTMKHLTVIKTDIPFSDILDLQIVGDISE